MKASGCFQNWGKESIKECDWERKKEVQKWRKLQTNYLKIWYNLKQTSYCWIFNYDKL